MLLLMFIMRILNKMDYNNLYEIVLYDVYYNAIYKKN